MKTKKSISILLSLLLLVSVLSGALAEDAASPATPWQEEGNLLLTLIGNLAQLNAAEGPATLTVNIQDKDSEGSILLGLTDAGLVRISASGTGIETPVQYDFNPNEVESASAQVAASVSDEAAQSFSNYIFSVLMSVLSDGVSIDNTSDDNGSTLTFSTDAAKLWDSVVTASNSFFAENPADAEIIFDMFGSALASSGVELTDDVKATLTALPDAATIGIPEGISLDFTLTKNNDGSFHFALNLLGSIVTLAIDGVKENDVTNYSGVLDASAFGFPKMLISGTCAEGLFDFNLAPETAIEGFSGIKIYYVKGETGFECGFESDFLFAYLTGTDSAVMFEAQVPGALNVSVSFESRSVSMDFVTEDEAIHFDGCINENNELVVNMNTGASDISILLGIDENSAIYYSITANGSTMSGTLTFGGDQLAKLTIDMDGQYGEIILRMDEAGTLYLEGIADGSVTPFFMLTIEEAELANGDVSFRHELTSNGVAYFSAETVFSDTVFAA